MITLEKNSSVILTDNDNQYSDFLQVAIEHSDPNASINLFKSSEKITIHITPSIDDFKNDIINNILSVHRILHLTPIFSSSLRISKKISFNLFFK